MLRISLFGSFRLVHDGYALPDMVTKTVQSLLAYLLLHISVGGPTERVKVPDIIGVDQRKAALALRRLGLGLVVSGTQPSRRKKGTILFQDPKPGIAVSEGSSLKVVVARPVIQ